MLEALAEHAAAADRHAEAYALHKEFHRVYERRLGMGTQARYYAVQIRYELNRLRDERDRAREKAVRDPLTGLYNRRYLDSVLADLVSILARSQQPMAVAMLDLDHFKAVNDVCGHPFGDEVLRALARILTDGTRAGDIVCRYGGEEFCLVFPNSTADDAVVRVETLLERLRATTVQLGPVERTGITFSAGVAGYPEDGVAPADRRRFPALGFPARLSRAATGGFASRANRPHPPHGILCRRCDVAGPAGRRLLPRALAEADRYRHPGADRLLCAWLNWHPTRC